MYGGRFPNFPYMGSMMGMPASGGLGYGPIRGMAGIARNAGMRGMTGLAGNAGRGLGLFSRLRGGMQAFRGIQWGSLLNNASRALGVVNQTITLVRQAGPMFNNMRSMIRLASVFKDETEPKLSTSNDNKVEKKEDSSNSSNLNSSRGQKPSHENLSSDNNSVIKSDSKMADDMHPNFFV